jgi:hypothetical protein
MITKRPRTSQSMPTQRTESTSVRVQSLVMVRNELVSSGRSSSPAPARPSLGEPLPIVRRYRLHRLSGVGRRALEAAGESGRRAERGIPPTIGDPGPMRRARARPSLPQRVGEINQVTVEGATRFCTSGRGGKRPLTEVLARPASGSLRPRFVGRRAASREILRVIILLVQVDQRPRLALEQLAEVQ